MPTGRPKNTLSDLWARVDVGGPDECWNWTGSTRNGYGRFTVDCVSHYAHRVAWQIANGVEPPKGHDFHVMHTCNNKLCCNPAHLVLGTSKENTVAAVSDGLFPVGKRNHLTKIDYETIKKIKADKAPQNWLARKYGVSQSHISRIKNKQTRRHEGV